MMVKSKFIRNETDEAQYYVAAVRDAINQLATRNAGGPMDAGEGQALRSFFDKLDCDKLQKGLETFGLAMPEKDGRSLAAIMDLTRNVPKDHKDFTTFMEKNGFSGENVTGGGSHKKFRYDRDPKQYVTYSPSMKLGTTGKKCATAMQMFMLSHYAKDLRDTLGQAPQRLARNLKETARQERKQLTR
jgi:hypothetical protein